MSKLQIKLAGMAIGGAGSIVNAVAAGAHWSAFEVTGGMVAGYLVAYFWIAYRERQDGRP